jgi:serine/threonine protein kinase
LDPSFNLIVGHGKAVDWWAFGTIIFEMMVGIPPFYDENVQEMYDKILHQDITFPDFMSDEACDLISRLLEKKPNKRFGTKSTNEIKK